MPILCAQEERGGLHFLGVMSKWGWKQHTYKLNPFYVRNDFFISNVKNVNLCKNVILKS